MLGRAGKNSIGLVKMLSDSRCLDLTRSFVELLQLQNSLQRKAAQAFRTVAPGVEIPAVAIAGQALGRNNPRSEEHTSELQSRGHLVCRLLLEKKKKCEAADLG